MKFLRTWLLLIGCVLVSSGSASAQTKLLRFPDISGDRVAFCYAGDIWTASTSGGLATRLTAHEGLEIFPKFSPDGQWIAFTGQYDGDEQVYIVPSKGGVPKQLTYYPARGPLTPRWGWDNQVYGWKPDGSGILFRSLRDADGGRTKTALYVVNVEGGLPERLPMPSAGAGDFSPDGTRMVYSPLFRDFRTWKRYQGGWAQDLYVFELNDYFSTQVASSRRTERDPMWIGEDIYFASDRDGTLNLYRTGSAGGGVEQLTRSKTWDLRWPSSDNKSRIVYELAGELQIFDIPSGRQTPISIEVPNDGLAMRPSQRSAASNIEDWELSPSGERALFVARGDVFTVPIEKGPTRNLTQSSRHHDRAARWSPNGRWISYVSDASGEDQIYRIAQDGSSPPEQLTTQFDVMLSTPEWSSDSQQLAFSDKDGKLFALEVESRKVSQVADDEFGGISDYTWSQNGDWLAFSMGSQGGYRSIYLWSNTERRLHQVTDPHFNAYSPTWGSEGKYLYYLSERDFSPLISNLEWNFAGDRHTGIFALALRKDTPHLFPSESDEVAIKEDTQQPEGQKGDRASNSSPDTDPLQIHLDGIGQRAVRIPVNPQNVFGLIATPGRILYVTGGASYYGRASDEPVKLQSFDLAKRESKSLAEGIGGVAVSQDGSQLLLRMGGQFQLMPSSGGEKKNVSTGSLQVSRIPAEEWAEVFDEVWRRYRDFFYVRNMHGYNWKEIGERYRTLLPHVAHRSDLNYVLGEMVAELNVGHAYIEGGDFEVPERPRVALPGARFALDPRHDRYQIASIMPGQNEEPRYRSPLTEVGVDARVGDYVLAIDGIELKAGDNPYRLLQHKTDPVTLTLNQEPQMEGARQVEYRPIPSEQSLLYLNWVLGNMKKVDEATGGRVGYLHVPDMGANGIYEFIKWFYPQIRKEGLVIDVRANGGGNVSQWLIERLDSQLLGTRFGYASDYAQTYPYTVFYGHMVCLIDETSASDGDIFPYRFRKAGLGPLIGKRTWGGVVGISSRGPLIDGGTVFVPLSGTNETDGSWIIEGEGVTPDIEVENDPASVIAGKDPQLERGIQEVLERMEANPRKLPQRPPDPVKTP